MILLVYSNTLNPSCSKFTDTNAVLLQFKARTKQKEGTLPKEKVHGKDGFEDPLERA